MSECIHNISEKVEAVEQNWLCPLCLKAENDKLKEELLKYEVVAQILKKAIPEFIAENFVKKP